MTHIPETPLPPDVIQAAASPILLVEGDPGVRRMLCRMLEALGFRVEEAANGYEALVVLQTLVPDVGAVLVDLELPVVSGRVVAETLNACRPELAVVCLTAGPVEPPTTCHPLVTKPFEREQLFTALGQAIAYARGLPGPPTPQLTDPVLLHARQHARELYQQTHDLLTAASAFANIPSRDRDPGHDDTPAR